MHYCSNEIVDGDSGMGWEIDDAENIARSIADELHVKLIRFLTDDDQR